MDRTRIVIVCGPFSCIEPSAGRLAIAAFVSPFLKEKSAAIRVPARPHGSGQESSLLMTEYEIPGGRCGCEADEQGGEEY